jgi:hypothetical protein
MFGRFLKACDKRIHTAKHSDSVYLLGGVSEDGAGRLLISDYRGKGKSLRLKIAGMDHAEITAERLDQESGPAPVEVQFGNGILTLPKSGKGSAAFLVAFRR